MKYSIPFLVLVLLSCQEDNPNTPATLDQFTGNWLVIEETAKDSNIKQHSSDGVITTWNDVSYIGAVKIKEEGSVKLNSYDGSYSTDVPDGTWTVDKRTSTITFTVLSFTKEFKIWREDDFLFFESSTHLIKHKAIE